MCPVHLISQAQKFLSSSIQTLQTCLIMPNLFQCIPFGLEPEGMGRGRVVILAEEDQQFGQFERNKRSYVQLMQCFVPHQVTNGSMILQLIAMLLDIGFSFFQSEVTQAL